ncbi:MAG: restriction endonuclease subunit S [Candidatus Brocadiaceae bacterium]|nr:restriction endonuclease subunit S [Candidatus Brocadiaceae bacterium]
MDSKQADYEYVYYFLKTQYNALRNLSSGVRKNLNSNDVKNFDIRLPEDVILQKKIAAVLSALDAKIELNNRINTELEAMVKTLYDYWFVQFDFPISKEQATAMSKPELTGKPYKSSGGKVVYNDMLKMEIPEGWKVYSLSELLRYNYNSICKQDSYKIINYLDTSSLTKNYLENTQQFNVENDKVPSRAKRIVSKNDILYSTVRPNQFHYGIIKHPMKNLIASTGFVQLNSKKDWVGNDLIYTFLTSNWVAERLQQIAELSVSSYPSISPNDILDLQIALPKQEKNLGFINSKFDTIYNMTSINHSENKQLAQLRDWLLPMLMNGQVTVK